MIVVGVVAGLLLIGALFLVLWAFYRYSDSWRDFVVEFMTGPVVLALTLVAELFDFSTDLAERILEDVGWRFSAPASVGFAVTLACQLVHPRTLVDHVDHAQLDALCTRACGSVGQCLRVWRFAVLVTTS